MSFKKYVSAIVLCACSTLLFSQNSVKVMHYNLMQFGNNFSDCNQMTNNVNSKLSYLTTIVNYVKPDIFTCNELKSDYYAQMILDKSLNVNGETKYKRAVFRSNSDIANTLFYNSDVIGLKKQDIITTKPRFTDVITLYYKSADLGVTEDTVFINCFITHLKAGSYDSNIQERKSATEQIMFYRKYRISENSLMMGDMNIYGASEPAFQNFTNFIPSDVNFNDPVNQEGEWNNNSNYKHYHTQSTHTGGDCFSSGGMDDRFDFILVSNDLLTTNSLQYKAGSYQAIGQDGSFFNKSLLSSSSSIPDDVKNALYNNSDHLPVSLELSIYPPKLTATAIDKIASKDIDVIQSTGVLTVFSGNEIINANVSIIDSNGRTVIVQNSVNVNTNGTTINVGKLNTGVFVLLIKNKNKLYSKKIIIK